MCSSLVSIGDCFKTSKFVAHLCDLSKEYQSNLSGELYLRIWLVNEYVVRNVEATKEA